MKVLSLWVPVVAMCLAIFYVSGLTSPPVVSGWKSTSAGHLMAYFVLGALALRAFARGAWAGATMSRACAAWGLAVLYGVSDEWHQSFVPGRTASVADVAVDALGAGVAVAIALAVRPWLARATRGREV